ncbi:membrane integrity-associated transporter subunit PqiC [Mangrovimicrobium sediminis]|uniref:Membrane integrity-associated transporter subunit PqiC n=1 Tax=Mangrovimicrobium sediminis TaxID=2562682 RepID=A0A4Z0LXR2_9GAMM|nr:PqiC family protein [Haliea sp. SAOS-164]TGD72071.1 membrane integrity-associated transporter subunit PqiC [Haliea sp. SAOS-164]
MHAHLRNTLALLALLGLLGACGSTPKSNHYILRAQAVPVETDTAFALGVGPVGVPPYLQRDAMVLSDGANRLDLANTERWAEPLEDGITRVMALNLAALLGTQDVRPYPWHPKRPPAYALKLRVLELDADSASARLVAEWLVYRPGDDSTLERRIARLQQPLDGDGPEAIAGAYSALFFQLSEIAAAAIEAAAAANPPTSEE